MLLKSIKLNNIRSYLNQKIDFPTGSVLLSGDIGSGKSTILLAIEFALFGVRRKHLSGSSLVRHGKKEADVELNFELDKKDIIIKRTLKRGKQDISQEAGYTIINGIKKEGTAVELKSQILELLGYPKELVTKSKDMVYRYTVYTPQEDMKKILFEEKETRLNILRRVFNIDKYKRIKENLQINIKDIKERKKESQGKIADLEQKKNQKQERKSEIKELDRKIKELEPKIKEAKKQLKEKKSNAEKTEKDIKKFNELKNELNVNEIKLKNNVEHREKNKEKITLLEKQISIIKQEIEKKETIDLNNLVKEIKEKENQINLMETTIKEINKKLAEFNTRKKLSNELKEKISQLDKCPTCLQDVEDGHKHTITERETNLLKEMENNISVHSEQLNNAEQTFTKLKQEKDELKKKEHNLSIIKIKLESLEEKNKEIKNLNEHQEKLKKEIGKINSNKLKINEKLEKFQNIDEEYKKLKTELETIQKQERKLEIEKTALTQEKTSLSKVIISLEEEIKEKLKIKENLTRLSELQNWLEKYFINLMSVMEKHIMLQIHMQFNELFQNWFNTLIEDETLSVRLDDEFTPVIEQNGYESAIENLSGGERTSVALSYRLALNKVINDIISDIKTKDLIILDEPTDGFSSEQLDKVREVLDQLNIKQTILVSHESKIESFVDNVITINKEEHVSSVI